MRGFLSLNPDSATRARLLHLQNGLRDSLTRQGVHFLGPDRLAATLLSWPYARIEELDEAANLLSNVELPEIAPSRLEGRPNDDRPGEIGFEIAGLETLQGQLFGRLRATLDPDPPKEAFIRLARISPPSRKVGAALRGSGLLSSDLGAFVPGSLALWRQNPQGYEVCRTIPIAYGRT